jgi:hypothetical protein
MLIASAFTNLNNRVRIVVGAKIGSRSDLRPNPIIEGKINALTLNARGSNSAAGSHTDMSEWPVLQRPWGSVEGLKTPRCPCMAILLSAPRWAVRNGSRFGSR